MSIKRTGCALFLILVLAIVVPGISSHTQRVDDNDSVVAGGPDQFVEVRHVVLKGSNFAIGKKIGELARQNGTRIAPTADHLLNRAKREYMVKNYPILYERMKGVASAYGLNIEDDLYDFTMLFQAPTATPGCSVVFYPAERTENGHDILSRNYDFTTGDAAGKRPPKGQLPMMARPILFEIHPDHGYSSLSLCAFEYLGGVLDGINSEGLAVSILAEEESLQKFGREPGNEVGLHELMSMRYLLDNCKNVEEAKEALLSLKHFYSFIPCHYIVADKTGKSFIFEFSSNRNRSYIIDGDGPQCITNHLVFHHPKIDELPEKDPGSSLRRYKMLDESIKEKRAFSLEEIAAINARVAVPPYAPQGEHAPGRTLWYALYDLDEQTLTVKFYLSEKPDPDDNSKAILDYSSPKKFILRK